MRLIDTHAHLYMDHFKDDMDAMMERARQNRVDKMILPNLDSGTVEDMLTLSRAYPEQIFPTIGLHPTSVKENYPAELKAVENWLEKHRFYAIGETGIDLYWDKTHFREQETCFRHQIELAKKHRLPIIIHTRESYDEVFAVMDELNDDNLRGVFHSFTGTLQQAEKIMSYGFYMGIGGILTFKNSGLAAVVKDIDLNHLVLETDAPFLSPVPKRGKRNESGHVRYIAEKLAEIKGIPLTEVAAITSGNAKNLFQLRD